MNTQENKVLACLTPSAFAQSVADYAAWAARALSAPLECLHVIDRHPEIATLRDHSGAIGMDAQEKLLEALSQEEGARSKLWREAGRLFLNDLRERALASGAPWVDVRQRYGGLEASLLEQQARVQLYVLGRRGQSSERELPAHEAGGLGSHLESVVRAVQRPILVVSALFAQPSRVMLAFDGGAVTRRGVQWLAASPLLRGLSIHIVMVGAPKPDAAQQLAWAQAQFAQAGFDVRASHKTGQASQQIAQAAQEEGVDLLVMDAYAHSALMRFLRGSKTRDLLRAHRGACLLLR